MSSLHGLHVYTESEAKEACWYMWRSLACPSTSRILFSGLRVSTHGKQVAPYSVRFLLTSQEGGRRANSTPGPARENNSIANNDAAANDGITSQGNAPPHHTYCSIRCKILGLLICIGGAVIAAVLIPRNLINI